MWTEDYAYPYRLHMGFKVLNLLKSQGIIVYALLSHISGVTQPLDVGLFGLLSPKLSLQ